MLKIRQTIINDYYTCGYKALLNWGKVGESGHYEENESKQNKYSATGIALHEAMELWGKDRKDLELKAISDYHQYLDEMILLHCPDELFEKDEKETFRISLHDQLDWLMEHTDSAEILEVELNFEVSGIFEGVEEPITGTIDRIDGDLEARRATLIDYKSGKTFTKKKLSTNVQALFYGLAFLKLYGFLPEKMVFYFSKHKKKQMVHYTPDFLYNAAAEFLSAYYKMAKNEYEPSCTNKFFCKNFCEHYNECPKYKKRTKGWDTSFESFNPNSNL